MSPFKIAALVKFKDRPRRIYEVTGVTPAGRYELREKYHYCPLFQAWDRTVAIRTARAPFIDLESAKRPY